MDFSKFKWYRKLKGGVWYKHQNTYQLPDLTFNFFWSSCGEINRFTKVVQIENYETKRKS